LQNFDGLNMHNLVYHLQYLTFKLKNFNIDLFADYKTKLLVTSIFPDLRKSVIRAIKCL